MTIPRQRTDVRAIGVYGGTFDPVHVAHMRLAIEALETLDLTKVIWVPTGIPGHREQPVASATHRLAMLEAALSEHPAFEIDDADIRSAGTTYTVRTLERLRALYGPDQPLVFIVGLDAFLGLTDWFDWPRLFELAHIAVAARPDYDIASAPAELQTLWNRRHNRLIGIHSEPAGWIVDFPMPPLDISASMIREKRRQNRAVRYLLPQAVEDYLERHVIYTLQESHGY